MKKINNFMIVLTLAGLLAGCGVGQSSTSSLVSSSSPSSSPSVSTSVSTSTPASSSSVTPSSSSSTEVKPTSITLSDSTLAMDLKDNKVKTLTPTVLPATATNKEVIWESGDPSICTVKNGTVTAIKAGTTKITVSSLADMTVKAECEVTVTDTRVASTFKAINGHVDGGKKNISENQVGFSGEVTTLSITYTFTLAEAEDTKLSAELSANTAAYNFTDVYQMTINGEAKTSTAKTNVGTTWGDYGNVDIGFYTLPKGDNTIIFTYDKNVTGWQTFNFRSFTIWSYEEVIQTNHECTSICPYCGKCLDPDCTNPACEDKCPGHNEQTFDYLITDDKVATNGKKGSDGAIGALAYKTLTIDYKIDFEFATTASLIAELSAGNGTVPINSIYKLSINGTDQAFDGVFNSGAQWSDYASYNLGNFSFTKGANHIVFSYDYYASPAWTFNFKSLELKTIATLTLLDANIALTSITLDKETLTIDLDTEATGKLNPTFDPSDATNTSVIWSSSDETVATVAADGTVTGLAKGETTITAASALDETIKDTCVVTVVFTNNTYAFSAVDDKVYTNGNKGSDGAIGAVSFSTVYIQYKVDFDKATTAILSADLSAAASSTAISDVYSLYINGEAQTIAGNLNAGSQWGSYATYSLGTYNFAKGSNVVTLTYDYNKNTAWTYNIQKIGLNTSATVTLMDANADYLTYDAASEDGVTIEGGITKDTTNDYLAYSSYTYNKAIFKVYAPSACQVNLGFNINRNSVAQWKFADYFDVFVNVDAAKCYRDDQLEYKTLRLDPTVYNSQTRQGDAAKFSTIDLGFVNLVEGENTITLGWNAPSAEYSFLVRNMTVGSVTSLSKTPIV